MRLLDELMTCRNEIIGRYEDCCRLPFNVVFADNRLYVVNWIVSVCNCMYNQKFLAFVCIFCKPLWLLSSLALSVIFVK